MSQYCPPRSSKKNPSRRSFLRATLVAASLASTNLAAGCKGGDDEDTRPLQDGAAYFPQSVLSGDPRPDSVIVWTRL